MKAVNVEEFEEISSESSRATCSHEQTVVWCCKFLVWQKHRKLLNQNWGRGMALTVTRWPKIAFRLRSCCTGVHRRRWQSAMLHANL